ncbi:MAG: outer membrane lipid asymmetry maintenance protein MlaD [Sphingomonadales bacterium]
MRHNLVETLMGAVVLLAAGLFVAFAYSKADMRTVKGYELTARFDRIDGLNVGTDVRLSGIKVGTVVGQELDPQSYFAIVRFTVDNAVRVPDDTMAKITSDGLLGGSYLALDPGFSEEMLSPGDEIYETQGAIDLLTLLSRFAGGSGSED